MEVNGKRTARFVCPFEDGWECGENTFSAPLHRKHSAEANAGPFSETMVCGRPCVAKVDLSLSMAAVAEVDETMCPSLHLE